MSIRNALLISLIVLSGGLALRALGPSRSPRPDVVLVVIDTLRADHLGSYGYERNTSPVIDAFAEQNLKFEYAMATAPWTAPSMASIFTGLYPTAHGVLGHADAESPGAVHTRAAVLVEELETLAEALSGNGYRTAGVTGNAWVADDLGFAQGFDEFTTHDYRPAQEINAQAFQLLDELSQQPDPFLLYVHYMDPHAPYNPPEPPGPELSRPLTDTPHLPSELPRINRYDAEIRHVDGQVGALFDRLRSLGLYRDAVIVLVSDHGEQFREHGGTGHDQNVFSYLIHVPLILKAPGLRGAVAETASILDIYPTLLELTGTPLRGEVQGVSLLRCAETERPGVFSEVTIGRNHKAFTRQDGKKLILSFAAERKEIVDRQSEMGPVGLFDLRQDSSELQRLRDEALLMSLRAGFWATYGDSVRRRQHVETPEMELTPQTVRRLKALGYLN